VVCILVFWSFEFFVYNFFLVLGRHHQTMDKVQKYILIKKCSVPFLHKVLHCTDNGLQPDWSNRLNRVKAIFNMLTHGWKDHFKCYTYMPDKPHKSGIKAFMLCMSDNGNCGIFRLQWQI
jgi:hypothetical protein